MINPKNIDEKYTARFGTFWQFVKFSVVSSSVSVVQLLLANILPLVFDNMTTPLPPFLQVIFDPNVLFTSPSKYVVNGVVTWGYVLPFLLSNGIANIYGYFINMKATFNGKGTKLGLAVYIVMLIALILFSTWLQGIIVAKLNNTVFSVLSRTIAALLAGYVQVAVIFPMEKYVLFKEK